MSTRERVDRLPPSAPDAERGILSCMMQDPRTSIPVAQVSIPDSVEAFYDMRHQSIYDSMVDLTRRLIPVDLITLQQDLRDNGRLEAVGGLLYLNELMDVSPSSRNLDYYIEIVKEKAKLRRLIQTCTVAIQDAYEDQKPPEDILSQAETGILACSRDNVKTGQTAHELINQYIEYCETAEAPPKYSWGFRSMDRIYQPAAGDLVVLAARTKVGKTAMALSSICQMPNVSTGIISLEMTPKALTDRCLSQISGIPFRMVEDPRCVRSMDEQNGTKLSLAAGKHAARKLVTWYQPGLSISQIHAIARQWISRYDIKVLFIDYIGLIRMPPRARNRYEGMTEISAGLKILAAELGLAVIALCQINREAADPSERPRIHHLRDSGSLEQDGDAIILLQPGEVSGKEGRWVHFDAVRNYQPGSVFLEFDGPTMAMREQPMDTAGMNA